MKQITFLFLLLMVSSWVGFILTPDSWGHDVGEPELEKLPIWSSCCGGGDCVPQKVRLKIKETAQGSLVEIDGVQTFVDNEKFSAVPSKHTWVCYIDPRGEIKNDNIRCILYPQTSGAI